MVWLDGVRDLTTDWHFNHTGWRIARPRFLGIHYQSLVHCTIEVDCQALQAHQPPRRHPARSLGIHRADPHEGDVVVKARGERQGMRADQGVIVAADIPRGHQHLIGAVLCEQQANIQGVGHHPQGFEPGELLRERQGRRTCLLYTSPSPRDRG